MRKLIYLDTAIDAVLKESNMDDAYGYMDTKSIVDLLNNLPSAQPEIVRCKDCKHYGCVLYSATQFEYGECFGHEESHYTFEVKPDDFCSRAERRTDERTD